MTLERMVTEAIVITVVLLALLCALFLGLWASPAPAADNGQYQNVDPAIREWFKGVRSPSGVPCCDIADGHRAQFEVRGAEFYVKIENEWVPVPPEAIIKGAKNPTGDAVVWFSHYEGSPIYIRCFVLPELS